MLEKKYLRAGVILCVLVLLPSAYLFRKCHHKRKPSKFYSETEFVEIPSSFDGEIQNAYFHKAKTKGRPLLISLHTWGGTYTQGDSLYTFAIENDWNYIHPDYRGPQWLDKSCCYEEAILDIDDAIQFALDKGRADTSMLFLVGKSGGASGVLASFIKSKFRNLKCYAWSPIPDYVQWYEEVIKVDSLKEKYLEKILQGTDSGDELNVENAKLKSPQYLEVKQESYYSRSSLKIYSGIMDGIKGSTSVKQPMLFYNKLLKSWNVQDSVFYFDKFEVNHLYNKREPIDTNLLFIGGRKQIHKEKYNNIEMMFFDGGHEILNSFMANELKQFDEIGKNK